MPGGGQRGWQLAGRMRNKREVIIMPTPFSLTRQFILTHARLLERLLFAVRFEGADPAAMGHLIDSYQNPGSGLGHARDRGSLRMARQGNLPGHLNPGGISADRTGIICVHLWVISGDEWEKSWSLGLIPKNSLYFIKKCLFPLDKEQMFKYIILRTCILLLD